MIDGQCPASISGICLELSEGLKPMGCARDECERQEFWRMVDDVKAENAAMTDAERAKAEFLREAGLATLRVLDFWPWRVIWRRLLPDVDKRARQWAERAVEGIT